MFHWVCITAATLIPRPLREVEVYLSLKANLTAVGGGSFWNLKSTAFLPPQNVLNRPW
jgi:hypothetical protein